MRSYQANIFFGTHPWLQITRFIPIAETSAAAKTFRMRWKQISHVLISDSEKKKNSQKKIVSTFRVAQSESPLNSSSQQKKKKKVTLVSTQKEKGTAKSEAFTRSAQNSRSVKESIKKKVRS